MRYSILSLLAMVLTASMFTSCGDSAAGKSPEEVVVAFANASTDMDFRTAKKFATAGSHELLDQLAGFASMASASITAEQRAEMEANKISVEDVNCNVTGETCTCDVTGGDGPGSMTLLQEGGAWKVDFSKDGMMDDMGGDDFEEGMEELEEGMEELNEALENN